MRQCTLAVLIKDEKILLQKKAEGLFGAGKWNGAGGKFEPSESAHKCMIRELKEEFGIDTEKIHLIGLLDFSWIEKKVEPIRVWVYIVDEYIGTPKSSSEGEVRWFKLYEIPYNEMWDDDLHWLPLAIRGQKFIGNFIFNYENRLVRHELNKVTESTPLTPPLYKNKCMNCGVEWFSDERTELCKQCSTDEQNKEMGRYEVSITVSEDDLERAQYGSIGDMERLADKVIEAAKKKGYVPSH